MELNQRMIWIEARQIGLQIAHREQLTGPHAKPSICPASFRDGIPLRRYRR
jgi:hypothetical protein